MRPDKLILVSATGTEVGKTWVAARLLERLRGRGFSVAARKPVQSFTPGSGPSDAELLAAAAGCSPERVCPPHRSYPLPLAPPIAAQLLSRAPFRVADLAHEVDLPRAGMAVVEAAGGWRSPLADDGDTRALAELIRPDLVVLVAESWLGAIHSVRSCLDTMTWPSVVFLNRYDATDQVAATNLAWLRERDQVDVITGHDELLRRVIGDAA